MPDRLGRIEPVGQRGGAAVERDRGIEDLEDRAHLVEPERGAVEARVVARLRPARAGSKSGSETRDSTSPVFRSRMMPAPPMPLKSAIARFSSSCRMCCTRTSIESCSGRSPPCSRSSNDALDPGKAAAIDVGVADQVRGEVALRIDPLGLGLEIDAGQAEAIDRLLLARRQVALQPHEAALGVELGGGRGDIEVRQHRQFSICAVSSGSCTWLGLA